MFKQVYVIGKRKDCIIVCVALSFTCSYLVYGYKHM